MGDFSELQKKLLWEIGEKLIPYGFDPKPRGQSFRKKTDFGWCSFHLSFIVHRPTDFDVTGDVAVRIDEVEALVNEENKLLTKSERSGTATIGAELGNISIGQPIRWNVVNDSDVNTTAREIMIAFVKVGIPYLDKYSNFEEVLSVLSGNESASWVHSPIHGSRCQRAIALAYIMREYDTLDTLIKYNESFLKARNDIGLRAFQNIAKKLRQK